MNDLKPWRRKFGVLVLLIACVTMAGWLNSNGATHAVSALCAGPENLIGMAAIDSHFAWIKTSPASHACTILPEVPLQIPAYTRPKGNWVLGPEGFGSKEIEWSWRLGDFGLGRLNLKNGAVDWQVRFFVVPWWFITIPLIALSAWLLLSQPRRTTPPSSPQVELAQQCKTPNLKETVVNHDHRREEANCPPNLLVPHAVS